MFYFVDQYFNQFVQMFRNTDDTDERINTGYFSADAEKTGSAYFA